MAPEDSAGVIPGYDGGPYTDHREFLGDHLFWVSHLAALLGPETIAVLLPSASDYEACLEYARQIWAGADWPLFTIPLRSGHQIYIVYRTFAEDEGVDYLICHPGWAKADRLAALEGHFFGPALSWPELLTAAESGLPGGSTQDPDRRLLLLLPAMGDENIPSSAVGRLTRALSACTRLDDPAHAARHLLTGHRPFGAATWRVENGARVCSGLKCPRNPDSRSGLPADHLASISAALSR